jgi:hypothetical protein
MDRGRSAASRLGRMPACVWAIGSALSFFVAVDPHKSMAAPDGPPAPNLVGRWKLVVENPGSGDLESAIVAIRPEGDKPRAEAVAMLLPFRPARAYVESSRDALVLVATTGYEDLVFKAPLAGDHPPGRIPGLYRFCHPQLPVPVTLPARIERTEAKDLAPPKERPGGDGGNPAPTAGMLGQLRAASEWADQRYRPLDLRLARGAAEGVSPDATTEEHLWAARRLAEAAKAAGPPEFAAEAEAKVAEWRRLLAEESRLPSGPSEPRGIRRGAGEDRVVLMELFTGAECGVSPPADRVFDILAESLPPAELIAIQYHLHIPAPDPLANPDAEARADYYGARATPTTYFNGQPMARGGAPTGLRPQEVQPIPPGGRRAAPRIEGGLDRSRSDAHERRGPHQGDGGDPANSGGRPAPAPPRPGRGGGPLRRRERGEDPSPGCPRPPRRARGLRAGGWSGAGRMRHPPRPDPIAPGGVPGRIPRFTRVAQGLPEGTSPRRTPTALGHRVRPGRRQQEGVARRRGPGWCQIERIRP